MSLLTCEPCGVQLSACLSLHVFPTLSSGVRLLECLFCVFTCLSSCVSRHVSPNLSVSKLICLQSSVCLSEWWCPALSPVRLCVCVCCVFHHMSLTFCLVLHLSPKPFVSSHMSALVAASCSSFIMILFVFRSGLCSLPPL